MKVILEFDGDTERDELETALKGWKYKYRLDGIWDGLFRGRHKHGYLDDRINNLLGIHEEGEGTEAQKKCNELMDILEQKYREILHDDE